MEVEIENNVKAQKEVQCAAEIASRQETNCTQRSKQRQQQQTSCAREYFARVEAEFQETWDDIVALMDNLIPSARRIAGTEGYQQRTLKRSSSLSKSILNRSQRNDRQHRKPRTTRIFRNIVVYPRTQSTTWSSCRGRALEICEEVPGDPSRRETSCCERRSRNSLEVTNSSVKLTPRWSRTFVAGCEARWTMHQLLQRWRVSKPRPRRDEVEWIETNIEFGAQSGIDRRTKKVRRSSALQRETFSRRRSSRTSLPRRQVHVEAHHEEVHKAVNYVVKKTSSPRKGPKPVTND